MNRAKRRSEADKAKKRVKNLWPWNQYDADARDIGILAKAFRQKAATGR